MTTKRVLECPACNGEVEIGDAVYAAVRVCDACGVALDISQPTPEILAETEPLANPPLGALRIGMKAEITNMTYLIVGRVRVREAATIWDMWLLRGPRATYLWIREAGGAGQLMTPFKPQAATGTDELAAASIAEVDGRPFAVTDRRSGAVAHLEGELTWRSTLKDPIAFVGLRSEDGIEVAVIWTEYDLDYLRVRPLSMREFAEMFHLETIIAELEHNRERADRTGVMTQVASIGTIVFVFGALVAWVLAFGSQVATVDIGKSDEPALVMAADLDADTTIATMELDTPGAEHWLTVTTKLMREVKYLNLRLQGPDGTETPMWALRYGGRVHPVESDTISFVPPMAGTYTLIGTGVMSSTGDDSHMPNVAPGRGQGTTDPDGGEDTDADLDVDTQAVTRDPAMTRVVRPTGLGAAAVDLSRTQPRAELAWAIKREMVASMWFQIAAAVISIIAALGVIVSFMLGGMNAVFGRKEM